MSALTLIALQQMANVSLVQWQIVKSVQRVILQTVSHASVVIIRLRQAFVSPSVHLFSA